MHNEDMATDDLITTTEAAALLKLDTSTIRHRILAGTLSATKRGRDLYVSRKTIQAEIDNRNVKPGPRNGDKPKSGQKEKS